MQELELALLAFAVLKKVERSPHSCYLDECHGGRELEVTCVVDHVGTKKFISNHHT